MQIPYYVGMSGLLRKGWLIWTYLALASLKYFLESISLNNTFSYKEKLSLRTKFIMNVLQRHFDKVMLLFYNKCSPQNNLSESKTGIPLLVSNRVLLLDAAWSSLTSWS